MVAIPSSSSSSSSNNKQQYPDNYTTTSTVCHHTRQESPQPRKNTDNCKQQIINRPTNRRYSRTNEPQTGCCIILCRPLGLDSLTNTKRIVCLHQQLNLLHAKLASATLQIKSSQFIIDQSKKMNRNLSADRYERLSSR